MNDGLLRVAGKTHRAAVDIDLVDVEALRLEVNLMALFVGKAHHLVLERRAIPGADAGDLSVVQGRTRDVLAHDGVCAIGRVQNVTRDLRTRERPCEKRERHGRLVASERLQGLRERP
jgi:hypothetical protein